MRSLAETSNFRSAAPTLLTTSKPIWNYELWVKLWLIGLVIPVYTLFIPWQRSMCSSLVFSFCVTEISPLTGSAYSPPQKSPEGQNVSASFLLHLHPALFLLFFFFLCVFIVSKPHAERANSRSYSLQMFVSLQHKTKICDILFRCKPSSMCTKESSLVNRSVRSVWVCR